MRVVCSSLQSMCKLLSMLPAEMSTLQQHMTSLLQSPQFWKHTKSPNSLVCFVSSLNWFCFSFLCTIILLNREMSGYKNRQSYYITSAFLHK